MDLHSAKPASALGIASEREMWFPRGDRVDRGELVGGKPYGDHLYRFGATARAAASAALQLLEVGADFGLVYPLLDLLVWICSPLAMLDI